jgi:hypothetical protein
MSGDCEFDQVLITISPSIRARRWELIRSIWGVGSDGAKAKIGNREMWSM